MLGRLGNLGMDDEGAAAWPMLARIAVAWVAGIVLGAQGGGRWTLVAGAGVAVLTAAWLSWRHMNRAANWSALVGLALIGGAWLVVQRDYVPTDHVSRFIHEELAIAKVRGTITSVPRDVIPDGGTFGGFSYLPPGTAFEMSLDAVDVGDGFEPASGGMLVSMKENDHRPTMGQRIEAAGWISAVGATQNPGEFDYRAYLRKQGIDGRVTRMRRGNWHALSAAPRWTLTGLRRQIGDAAASSLRLGLPEDPELVGLLDALLLGRRAGEIKDLSDSFRAVGLSHVLSISGAHLGILLLIVWALGRLLIGRPGAVAVLVMVVLALFLLAVPWRTPIVRAAIMAAVFCAGYGMGRRLTGAEVLSAATLIVLIWKPTDLFSAGFQLSFGVVGALLLFTKPVSRWMMAEPDAMVVHPTAWDLGVRWGVDFLAVSVVAFVVALPMVMYHFLLVSPLAILMSMLALPVLTAVLAVGYLKIIVGLVSPALGSLLAVPLAWMGGSLSGLVTQAQRWPGASFDLWSGPSVAWTLVAVACVLAVLAGVFHRRYALLAVVLLVLVGWGWAEQRPSSVMRGEDPPALVVNMFAVGDGSCFLLRSGEESLMFDCGSQGFWQVGERSIVPALKALGVRRIDTLMLSHADLDHFVGALDVMDGVEVGRVLVSPDVFREAAKEPGGAAGFLLEGLRKRGHEPVAIERGWAATMGEAELRVLWPEQGYASKKNNNNGLVLRIEAAGRSVLLNSDIQDEAIERLLAVDRDALRADVSDLAHHGSFVEQSPAWLAAVDPQLVLQSSGPRRVDQDNWADVLKDAGIDRLWTAREGMVELVISPEGAISWSTYRGDE